MANDIIDINVTETVETVAITVNPNLTTVNINQVTGGGGSQDLQSVTDIGAITTNSITANSITTIVDSTINGVRVGRGNISGTVSENTAVGYQALQSVVHTTGSTGYYNTAVGASTLKTLTTGFANDAFGDAALLNLTTGTYNLAIGTAAMLNSTTATQNTAIGQYALQNNILGQKNTAIGLSALGQNTASFNTAIGSYAGGGVSSTGTENILVGYQAGSSISSGRNNLLIENQSGGTITSGSYNIILNPKQKSGVTTGSNNTIIGCFDNTLSAGLTSNVIIGNGTGAVRFQSTDTGLTTVPAQTNTLINGDASGKAVVTKEYLSNSQTVFVPYTGATTDVDLGLNDITAEKLIKSGGTSSEILAADGSVITAGNNITITGGQISSVGGTGGGGSSVNYYLNGGTSQGTFGGTTYYEFSKTAVIGTEADFNISSNGYIASFITDVADPSLLLIPAGNWNLEFFFSSSSAGGSPSFYAELYKYDGTTFTLIASGSAVPEGITNGTSIDAYFTALAVPETVLTVNDRLAIRVYVNASSKTITLHTQNGHLCEVITTFTAGLTALNGLQTQVQNFAVGTSGTDFAINSSGSTHTFNLPTASASNRGALSSANWTTFNGKQDTLQNTVNIKSINGNTILGSGDLVISGTGISSLNGLTGATQTFSILTNFSGSPSFVSSGTNHQLRLPNAGASTDYGLVTNIGQTFSGTKVFANSIEIPAPVPANPIGIRCIVLGDPQGNLTVGSTTNYPSGQEMQYVKGVTSSVQTQLDSKASGLDVAEQTYSLSPTFTGTAPTIISSSTYQWNKVGTLVTGRVNLIYTTPGSISQVVIPLPADMPTPLSPTGLSGALDVLYYGVGMFNTLTTSVAAVNRVCFLRRNTLNTGYEFVITHSAAVSSRVISLTLQYFTE
jgi:hypothetical protein